MAIVTLFDEMDRIKYLDIMKGIGIVLVVIGHGIFDPQSVLRVIYLFHMPLFFIISGYLFKQGENKSFIIRKARQLIVPYFIFLFLLMPFSGILTSQIWDSKDPVFIGVAFAKVLIGGRNMVYSSSVLWFISCLFLTQIMYNFITNRFSLRTTHIVIGISLVLAYVNYEVLPEYWLAWNANVVLYALPLFHLGYRARFWKFRVNNVILLILCVLTVGSSIFVTENALNMKSNMYGIPILTFACGIIFTLLIKSVAEGLEKFKYASLFFNNWGKGSLIIMYVHLFILIETKKLFGIPDGLNVVCALILSYLFYLVVKRFTITRALLMGSIADQSKMKLYFDRKKEAG